MRLILALFACSPLLIGSAAPGRLDVTLAGLRNQSGDIRLCLSHDPRRFPDCTGDPAARMLAIRATSRIVLPDLPAGTYAVAVFHDENRNARLDTFAKIPREGFGFSRNPPVRFGPPQFAQARFAIGAGTTSQTIRMRYYL